MFIFQIACVHSALDHFGDDDESRPAAWVAAHLADLIVRRGSDTEFFQNRSQAVLLRGS